MWKNITDTIGNITTVAVQLIGLSVALEVVFGANVPFLIFRCYQITSLV